MFGCYRATLTSPCVLYSGELIVRVMLQACWLSLAGEVYACRLDIIIRFLEIGFLAMRYPCQHIAVVDLGRVRGCKCTPLWQLVMYFCVHNCTSPSNDYATVACSNNNKAQLHTHISVPYCMISRRLTRPRVALRYSIRTSSYFKQLTS